MSVWDRAREQVRQFAYQASPATWTFLGVGVLFASVAVVAGVWFLSNLSTSPPIPPRPVPTSAPPAPTPSPPVPTPEPTSSPTGDVPVPYPTTPSDMKDWPAACERATKLVLKYLDTYPVFADAPADVRTVVVESSATAGATCDALQVRELSVLVDAWVARGR